MKKYGQNGNFGPFFQPSKCSMFALRCSSSHAKHWTHVRDVRCSTLPKFDMFDVRIFDVRSNTSAEYYTYLAKITYSDYNMNLEKYIINWLCLAVKSLSVNETFWNFLHMETSSWGLKWAWQNYASIVIVIVIWGKSWQSCIRGCL